MSINILNMNFGNPAGKLIEEVSMSFEKKKQRRHEFWILSCYVDFNFIEKYVDKLLSIIKITDIYLAFNFAEIYRLGPLETEKKLFDIQKKLHKTNVDFKWRALASSKLVHSKGYALIQRSKNTISGGAILVTSANFTVPGFEGDNVEMGYISTKKQDIRDFEKKYNELWDILGVDFRSAVFKQEEYLLKFALLSSGFFLHKWSGSLSQEIGIKYKLTELAKMKGTIAPELAAVGFEAGDTFTMKVLKLENLPSKEIPRAFIARFTIETYWGRWCLADAWSTLSKSFEGAEEFIKEFQNATEEDKLSEIKEETLKKQSKLIDSYLLEPVKTDHLDRWMFRMQELRKNNRRLERFFTGYEAHLLPYTIEQKTEVNDLFNSILEGIALTKARNIAKEKILAASEESDPTLLSLTDEEKEIIISMSCCNDQNG